MPSNVTCPNCEKPGIGYWQKQLLGPARTISCSHCGAHVSISFFSFVPILLIIFTTLPTLRILGMMDYGFASYAGAFVFLLVVTWVYLHYFVPLVVRSLPANE